MAAITIENVEKTFAGGVQAVRRVSLRVNDGEFLVLVGPSGCGKTTLLRMIAGLDEATGGTISIGDRAVNDLPPAERDLAMVFQNYALYPHMTVRRNMAFALELRKVARAEIDRRVGETAETLGLRDLLERRPKELSGGQRQRVALGRAIVRQPLAFLFDEPLSNLDARLRIQMRAELKRLHRRLRTTSIYVTHDQEEAMTLGDRVVVMKDGAIQQVGRPLDVYERPANRFVAGFMGMPPMNLLPEGSRADGSGRRRPPDPAHRRRTSTARSSASGPSTWATALRRPCERLALRVRSSSRWRPAGRHLTTPDGTSMVARIDSRVELREGDEAAFYADLSRVHLFDDRTGGRLESAPELARIA
jgi:multiple sugar transport system ATP-binding protein